MGRVKRAIIEVEDTRTRRITCKKRSAGAMKKLHELAILCNQDIFLYIRDQETGKIRTFASCDEKFIPDYAAISQEDCKGPKDMEIYYNQQHRQKQPASQTRTEQQQSTQPVTMISQPPSLDHLRRRKESPTVRNKVPSPRLARAFNRLISQSQICQRTLRGSLEIFAGVQTCIRWASLPYIIIYLGGIAAAEHDWCFPFFRSVCRLRTEEGILMQPTPSLRTIIYSVLSPTSTTQGSCLWLAGLVTWPFFEVWEGTDPCLKPPVWFHLLKYTSACMNSIYSSSRRRDTFNSRLLQSTETYQQ